MATASLTQLRESEASGSAALFGQLLAQPRSTFDPDAWHVMQERDNALIRDEIMHGYASKAFVYSFEIKGSKVNGISVVGARELASQYKGIKSRIVATIEKRGALFIFRSFNPLSIETRTLMELEGDDDFYECVMEVSDIKTGNSIEVRKKESRTERKRDGSTYERPHYDVIAESKAFRNGVLSVLPQSVIKDFQAKCLQAGNTSNEATIQQRRAAASTYATKNGIALDRQRLNELSFAELDGLGGAASGGLDAFKRAASALNLIEGSIESTGEIKPAAKPAASAPSPAPAPSAAPAPAPSQPESAGDWEPNEAELAAIHKREMAEANADQAEQTKSAPTRRARSSGNVTAE